MWTVQKSRIWPTIKGHKHTSFHRGLDFRFELPNRAQHDSCTVAMPTRSALGNGFTAKLFGKDTVVQVWYRVMCQIPNQTDGSSGLQYWGAADSGFPLIGTLTDKQAVSPMSGVSSPRAFYIALGAVLPCTLPRRRVSRRLSLFR